MDKKLELLKKEIPCQWRVQSFSKTKPQAQCVAYIDARDVMDLLDEVVGAGNWSSDFKDIGGQTFAGIGIFIDSGWVWKWDTGSESNIEKEKGQASDSLKRAAVQWGIGRFLYSKDIKYVKANELKTDKNFPYCVDDNGNRIWDLSKHINALDKSPSNAQNVSKIPTPEEATAKALEMIKNAQSIKELQELDKKIDESKYIPNDKKIDLAFELQDAILKFDPTHD